MHAFIHLLHFLSLNYVLGIWRHSYELGIKCVYTFGAYISVERINDSRDQIIISHRYGFNEENKVGNEIVTRGWSIHRKATLCS